MPHPHTELAEYESGLNFVTDIGPWYLRPEISVVAIFTAKIEVGSHMILLNFSHSSKRCIQLTYLKITMPEPSRSNIN